MLQLFPINGRCVPTKISSINLFFFSYVNTSLIQQDRLLMILSYYWLEPIVTSDPWCFIKVLRMTAYRSKWAKVHQSAAVHCVFIRSVLPVKNLFRNSCFSCCSSFWHTSDAPGSHKFCPLLVAEAFLSLTMASSPGGLLPGCSAYLNPFWVHSKRVDLVMPCLHVELNKSSHTRMSKPPLHSSAPIWVLCPHFNQFKKVSRYWGERCRLKADRLHLQLEEAAEAAGLCQSSVWRRLHWASLASSGKCLTLGLGLLWWQQALTLNSEL